ncbi:Gfo/Idh/MocA family oxidoreductase [bacterium]|nr:Gfo/Idh/MocA family oxidoreductase [bacterium]
MDKTIGVAVVGIGSMGKNHARVFSEIPNVKLVGLSDINEETAREYAKKFNTEYFKDYRDLFDKIDAVCLAVPTSLHHRMAMDFLNHGIHVFVEKPITNMLFEAKEIVDLAKEKDLVLQVGHLERFNPAVIQFKKMLKSPVYIQSSRIGYPSKRNLDIGVIWDLMIHDLDILLTIVKSPVADVQAYGLSLYSKKEDIAHVQILFENGAIASLLASRISGERQRTLKVIEPLRTFNLDFINQTLSVVNLPKEGHTNPPEFIPIRKSEPLRLELEHFTECVIGHKTPLVTGEDGKNALQLAIKAVDNMKMVKMSDSSDLAKFLQIEDF